MEQIILPGSMVSDIQKVVLWGASVEDLELVASSVNPGGFQTEGYSGDLASFEASMRSRADVAAIILIWSPEIRDALAARLFCGAPVAVIDHVYRAEAAQDLFALGVALYLGKRELGLLPAALSRVIAERRSGAAFGRGGAAGSGDQLSLTVLHDLANILTGVQGKLRLLGDDASPSQKGEMELLEQTCRAAVDLVRQSLSLNSPDDEDAFECDAALTLRQIGSLFRALLPPAVIFEEHLPTGGVRFGLGRAQVIQVALNLLLNARDAVLERAAVSEPSDAYVPYVQLGCSARDGNGTFLQSIVLHVRDNGPGMEPEVLRKVFEPGFTTKPAGRGSGLGLLSVREVLRRCGGSIDASSRPGTGTEFLAHIPCARPAAEHRTPGRDRIAGHDGGTVLVVEDDALLAAVLQEVFEDLGFHLLLAQDSVSALQLLKESKSKVNLVVSDFSMPGLTGLDLKSLVNTFSPETKFILCSGYGLSETEGVSDSLHFIRKPYHTEELIAKVRKVLAEG